MIRRRQVFPDESGTVSREALLEAMIDCATFLDFAGGTLSVVVQRAPTVLPGEMVTVGAVVEWRHDARVQPRPEQFEQPTAEAQHVEDQRNAALMEADPETAALAGIATPDGEDNPDGFDYSKLAPEDIDEPVSAAR
jgi:hypothetical protein